MKTIFATAFLGLFALPFAFAGDATQSMAAHWKKSKEYTLAIAEQMPAADYGFKPNPEEMSFGEQMAHIAGADGYFLSVLSGGKPPAGKPANFEKATVIALLNTSFDYAIHAVENATPAQLAKTYKTPDGEMTGTEIVYFGLDHTTHHRGQCVVYLRVKGIKPADYRY